MATTMSMRKVRAIFDNGTSNVLPSHFLLPEDGTVGDAVDCFKKHHAPDLWKIAHVELVGILSEKDLLLPYGKATPSLTLESFKLQDMMEPSKDFLVFRSSLATGDSETGGEAEENGTEVKEEVPKDAKEQNGHATEQQGNDGEEEPQPLAQESNKAANNRSSRAASELKRLADFNLPPMADMQRSRKKRPFFDPTDEERPRKKARAKDTTKPARPRKKKSSGHQSVGRPKKKRAKAKDRMFGVGTRHFYQWHDGDEYAVTVVEPDPSRNLRSGERVVAFEGYSDTHRVKTSNLLPATRKREAQFRMHEQEEDLYGQRTSWTDPLPRCTEPGTLHFQKKRRVYFAKHNETPLGISKKVGVSAGRIVYDNRQQYPSLEKSSRFKHLTPIVLPLE